MTKIKIVYKKNTYEIEDSEAAMLRWSDQFNRLKELIELIKGE